MANNKRYIDLVEVCDYDYSYGILSLTLGKIDFQRIKEQGITEEEYLVEIVEDAKFNAQEENDEWQIIDLIEKLPKRYYASLISIDAVVRI